MRKERSKRIWKKQVEEERMKVSLNKEDAICRSTWIVGANHIATILRFFRSPSLVGDTIRF